MSRPPPTLAHAVRSLAATLVAAGRTRFELFSLELAEQKTLVLRLVLAMVVAMACLGMAVLVFTGWVIAAFWDTPHRLLAIALVGLFWLVVGGVAAWRAWRAVQQAPAPFELTLAELARDAHALGAGSRGVSPQGAPTWPPAATPAPGAPQPPESP